MKPRTETKLLIERSQLPSFYQWLSRNSAKGLYVSRRVSSTYFDNSSLQMFQETAQGLIPRRKMRIRCYGHHSPTCGSSHFVEIKQTDITGRSKSSLESDTWKRFFRDGWSSSNYGVTFPKAHVTYVRDYFSVLGVRLTIDRDITYFHPDLSNHIGEDDRIAVEIKAAAGMDPDWEANTFPFSRIHFSKYERAMIRLGASA